MRIKTLRDEARNAGDEDQADVCERALSGDQASIDECNRVIAAALSMLDED
jgi:hypothetical protein